MANLLHISSNEFPPLNEEHSTKKIWHELAKGFKQYHILARSKDNKFHNYREGNIFLHLVPKLGKAKSFFFSSVIMIKIIKKYNIDVMLSQCPLMGGYFGTFISKVTKIPIMVEIHGMEYFRILDSKLFYNKVIAKMIRYSFKNATKVRSLSNKMTDMLIERKIEANIIMIPNRVNCELFNMPKIDNKLRGKIKVISVGRFVWEKAYDIAINAIKELHNKYDIELTLIGGGPLYDKYRILAYGCEYINLIQWLPQDQFVPMLNSADIYIQPSISEGMPRTILEAMAVKLPVISSDVGAVSGVIVDKVNGLLIEPNNMISLKNAIEELINNSDLRENIALNGYKDATINYEWNIVFEKYRNEIIDMIK